MPSILARPNALLLLLPLVVGCSKKLPAPESGTGGAEPRRGGMIELATFADLRSLDPANVGDGLAPQMLEPMFAGLIDYDRTGKIVPDLAERWVIEDEGTTYRFTLRPGVKFHDGEEVTADDVKRSAERALHPTAPNPFAPYYSSIVGHAEFTGKKAESLSGVSVDGKYVVSFKLKEPDATFLYVLAMLPLRPVCKSGGSRYSDTWHPCGAGPFKLMPGGWQHGHELRIVRHDGYFRPGLPYLDGIRWTFKEPATGQTFKFLRGELDILRDFVGPDILRFSSDPRWSPFASYESSGQIIGDAMNVEMPPFDNVEIRRAVTLAIDRDALVQVRSANLRVQKQLIPEGVFGHDPDLPNQQHHDLQAALEHMRKAGYPYDPNTKKGGWPHPVPYLIYPQSLQDFLAQVLAQQLERIGIRLELRSVNYPTFLALRGRRKASPFGPSSWLQDFPEGMSFLEPLFHSKSIANEDCSNQAFYANPRFDDVVDRAHKELDDERRKRLYSDAQTILLDDAPWSFTATYGVYTQRQAYVRDHSGHPIWTQDFSRTWLDRAASQKAPTSARSFFTRPEVLSFFGAQRR